MCGLGNCRPQAFNWAGDRVALLTVTVLYAAQMAGRHPRSWYLPPSLVPRPSHSAFVTCSTKSGGKAWTDLSRDACHCWRHVQSAHIWVCSLPCTLLSLNSVRSFGSVCPASPIATGSIMASYSTWHQQGHASLNKSVQVTKAGCGGLGKRLPPTSI